jgi:hypothetical protein
MNQKLNLPTFSLFIHVRELTQHSRALVFGFLFLGTTLSTPPAFRLYLASPPLRQ